MARVNWKNLGLGLQSMAQMLNTAVDRREKFAIQQAMMDLRQKALDAKSGAQNTETIKQTNLRENLGLMRQAVNNYTQTPETSPDVFQGPTLPGADLAKRHQFAGTMAMLHAAAPQTLNPHVSQHEGTQSVFDPASMKTTSEQVAPLKASEGTAIFGGPSMPPDTFRGLQRLPGGAFMVPKTATPSAPHYQPFQTDTGEVFPFQTAGPGAGKFGVSSGIKGKPVKEQLYETDEGWQTGPAAIGLKKPVKPTQPRSQTGDVNQVLKAMSGSASVYDPLGMNLIVDPTKVTDDVVRNAEAMVPKLKETYDPTVVDKAMGLLQTHYAQGRPKGGGGGTEGHGTTESAFGSADAVREAYQSGKITKEKAREIISNQFPDDSRFK